MKDVLLAIESSCDDTGIAMIDMNGDIVFNKIISQTEIHSKYGGVVPEIASRNHLLSLQKLTSDLVKDLNYSIIATAATCGPGLVGGLISGMMFAKGMAQYLGIPFLAINHLEGHLLSGKINNKNFGFPFIGMLISGGHCQIIRAEKLGDYKIFSTTVDDAPGEAFDKIGRRLNLPYPAGKYIDNAAKNGTSKRFSFTVPKIKKEPLNMSFSGLKTSITRKIESLGNLTQTDIYDLSLATQQTISKILLNRLEKIILCNKDIKNLTLCGGVAANSLIRSEVTRISKKYNMSLYIPELQYCTDNAAMIAMAGLERYKAGFSSSLNFIPITRWSVEDLKLDISR